MGVCDGLCVGVCDGLCVGVCVRDCEYTHNCFDLIPNSLFNGDPSQLVLKFDLWCFTGEAVLEL